MSNSTGRAPRSLRRTSPTTTTTWGHTRWGNCAACRSIIVDGEEYLSCTLDKCKLKYHLQCSGEVAVTEECLISWVCPECACFARGKSDCSITLTQITDPNITFRKKSPEIQGAQNQVEFQELAFEMSKLRLEMETLKEQLSKAVSLVSHYECKLTGYASQIELLNTQLKQSAPMLMPNFNVTDQQQTLCVTTKQQPQHATTHQQSQLTPVAMDTTSVQSSHRAKKHKNARVKGVVSTVPVPTSPNQSVVVKVNPTNLNIHTSENIKLLNENEHTTSADRDTPAIDLTSADNDHSFPAIDHPGDQSWTEVKKKKLRKPASLCGIAGPDVTKLRAVEPRKHLHLWNMESSAEEIREYLRLLCPTGACTVEELRARGSYKSYKIGVPINLYEKCYSVDVWPMNARVNTWTTYENPRHTKNHKVPDKAQTLTHQQTFRA